jgi:Virulence factor
MSHTYQIVYWRDIPAQVRLRSGRERISRPLAHRFQEAIDAAAMIARTTSTDDYLEEWRSSEWLTGEGDPDPERFADDLVAQLESDYPPARLETLMRNAGREKP